MSRPKHICYYCLEIKPENEFNAEHVVQESFGLFGIHTMTLNNKVCTECNDYFGNNLDIILARDTVFGILYRTASGILSPKKFRKSIQHRRRNMEPTIDHPDHGNLLIDLNFTAAQEFSVNIANQIIVMNSTKGRRCVYRPDILPNKAILDGNGLVTSEKFIRIFISAFHDIKKNVEKINLSLKKNEINLRILPNQIANFKLDHEFQIVHFNSKLSTIVLRAVAKMAFNYFIYNCNHNSILLNESFNDIRNFIRYGHAFSSDLIDVSHNHLYLDLYHPIKPFFEKHIIKIYQDYYQNIFAEVDLFKMTKFKILLCRKYPVYFLQTMGHNFNFLTKTITRIT